MASFTAGQFPSDAAKLLIEILQHEFCGDPHWKFHPGVSYRNLLVYRSRGQTPPFAIQTLTTPPHDITGQHIEPHLPTGPGSDLLRQLMDRSRTLFAKAPPNLARAASNLPQATQIWLWGLGSQPVLQPFLQRYNVRGAVITAVDLLRGIGKLLGWKIINVPGATGYLDTDYAAKGRAAIETLAQPDVDFVVVHVEATDEASHEGNAREKIHALEQIDQHIVGPLHNWLKTQSNYRLLICPDHPTFLRTRTHSHGFCPFAWCGTGIPHSGYTEYHEKNANLAHLCFHDGFNLIRNFLHQ
jgi:2,3-bisphosphoglycerate-independent phosphoglycerate mutase